MDFRRSSVLLLTVVLSVSAHAGSLADPIVVSPSFGTGATDGNADDPAIWNHPTDPARSVVIGTDKDEGIYVWDLAGNQLQHLPQGTRTNNVDVRSQVAWAGGTAHVVAANLREVGKLAVFLVNPDYDPEGGDVLAQIAGAGDSGNDIQSDSYGFGLYRSPGAGTLYVFDKPKGGKGEIRQYRVEDDGSGGVLVTPVRDLDYDGGTAEGMVADDELGFLYVAEEGEAIHKYLAAPEASPAPVSSFAQDDGISGDREGVALYLGQGASGYLLLSSQGNDTVKVYERGGDNAYVTTIDTVGSEGTDGLEATSQPSPSFPEGVLVTHDSSGSNYNVYDWADLVAQGLTGGPSPPALDLPGKPILILP